MGEQTPKPKPFLRLTEMIQPERFFVSKYCGSLDRYETMEVTEEEFNNLKNESTE